MNGRIGFLALLTLFQLVLAFSPFIPGLRSLWNFSSESSAYTSLFVLLGTNFVLLTLAVSTLSLLEQKDISSKLAPLLARISGAIVRAVRDDEFYDEFLQACRRATSHVDISYLSAFPPDRTPDPQRRRYYANVLRVMKQTPHVRFRRIVRASTHNKEWLRKLIKSLENYANTDLSLLSDLPEEYEMPLSLSVQIVDDRFAWLVAISSHERVNRSRDLHVEHEQFATSMRGYYNRLWSLATPLISSGVITDEGRKILNGDDQ